VYIVGVKVFSAVVDNYRYIYARDPSGPVGRPASPAPGRGAPAAGHHFVLTAPGLRSHTRARLFRDDIIFVSSSRAALTRTTGTPGPGREVAAAGRWPRQVVSRVYYVYDVYIDYN
jgi:hypothetical protein